MVVWRREGRYGLTTGARCAPLPELAAALGMVRGVPVGVGTAGAGSTPFRVRDAAAAAYAYLLRVLGSRPS